MKHELAKQLMDEFAKSSGITGKAAPRRYLWTDAFAVCNFLGIYRETVDASYLKLALDLVDQVHHILGKHRTDDSREGWISGLDDEQGERHPTCGGLRIGKKLNEGSADQPSDSRLQWDQDGQYFHYLTKWMHALSCVARETNDVRYLRWATELAITAHKSFTYQTSAGGPLRMVWKMSIDLCRPQVDSMGHHDPLNGLVTSLELQTADGFLSHDNIDLGPMIADMARMCANGRWATEDPLGIGGLLDDAVRLAQMVFERGLEYLDLLAQLLRETESSLRVFAHSPILYDSAERRLAFRELGLSIGLRGLEWIKKLVSHDDELAAIVSQLMSYQTLSEQIEAFWLLPGHREGRGWMDHRDINTVMLGTSLAPEGYVTL